MIWKKDENRSIRHSITWEMTLLIIGLVAGTVVLCWFLNTTFLESYYTYNKQESLLEGFATINRASGEGTLNQKEFDIEFEKICANGNLAILVISSDGSVVRSSSSNDEKLKVKFMEVLFGNSQQTRAVLKKTNNYVLERQKDTRLDSEYLVLWGTLSNGNLVMMRTALESIRESVKISNQFLAYVGMFAIVISAILIAIISMRITTPILQLTEISKKMTDLDFDIKYTGNGKNEIDQLGHHINQLSMTLEQTISKLKSANNELMQDLERKEQVDEMRKEFLSNVSHELKTPLALIQGYAEGLQECINEDEESREFYCEVIVDEADKMNQLVKKLLTLNQLEFGNDSVVIERFDLTELIRGVVQASSIMLRQNGISLTFAQESPMYVWADEFKVEEVVTNYLSNAIHHAEFEKKIDISYTCMEERVRVSVFNTGKQIPREDLEHIWDKFYKVDKARTREYGGSGIGLSIVKAIMDSFHSSCGVENHENGVKFWFELDSKSRPGTN